MEDKKNNCSSFMTVLNSSTIRGIVREVNEENIKKENIVTLLKDNNQYILIYFK